MAMNSGEIRLTERLIQTGRITPDELKTAIGKKGDGEGLMDTLVAKDLVSTKELELVLAELPGLDGDAKEPDTLRRAVRQLDRYMILQKLGRGGMGSVYLAYDTKLKRSVALKCMHVEEAVDLKRYEREVEVASSLHHPNIAAVYDTETIDDVFVISMQYIDGKSLDEVRLSIREALETVAESARALETAHEKTIVHRDIKPGNLMRTDDGKLFVMDFGTARPIEKEGGLTQTGSIIGTPAFMSPEQAQGHDVDERTDIYSLGATLYALVTNQPPYEGTALLEVIRKVASEKPIPPRKVKPRLHRDIETIILKAMDPDPSRRYATAKDLAKDIERFLAGEPIEARPLSRPKRAYNYLRRRPWAMAAVIAMLVGMIGMGAVFAYWMNRQLRLDTAQGRVDEAGDRIEKWDQLLYRPPGDLRPYRSYLTEAQKLCTEAMDIGGGDFAPAHYMMARVRMRLGRTGDAFRSIDRAIELEEDCRYVIERIRMQLQEFELRIIDLNNFVRMGEGQLKLDVRPHLKELFREAHQQMIADFEKIGNADETTMQEFAYLYAVEEAIQGRLDKAEEMAQKVFQELRASERDELHKVLAMLDYMRYYDALGDGVVSEIDFEPAKHLANALAHLDDAIDIKRSDAHLYFMRALMRFLYGYHPVQAVQVHLNPMGSVQDETERKRAWKEVSPKIKEKLADVEKWGDSAYRLATLDIDGVITIRPDDFQAYLVQGYLHVLRIPLRPLVRMLDAWADLEKPGRNLVFMATGAAFYRKLKDIFLTPAVESIEKALEVDPEYGLGWLALAGVHLTHLAYGQAMQKEFRAEVQAEALLAARKAREFSGGHSGTRVGAWSIVAGVRIQQYNLRDLDRDEARRLAMEAIEKVRAINPERAEQLEKQLP